MQISQYGRDDDATEQHSPTQFTTKLESLKNAVKRASPDQKTLMANTMQTDNRGPGWVSKPAPVAKINNHSTL